MTENNYRTPYGIVRSDETQTPRRITNINFNTGTVTVVESGKKTRQYPQAEVDLVPGKPEAEYDFSRKKTRSVYTMPIKDAIEATQTVIDGRGNATSGVSEDAYYKARKVRQQLLEEVRDAVLANPEDIVALMDAKTAKDLKHHLMMSQPYAPLMNNVKLEANLDDFDLLATDEYSNRVISVGLTAKPANGMSMRDIPDAEREEWKGAQTFSATVPDDHDNPGIIANSSFISPGYGELDQWRKKQVRNIETNMVFRIASGVFAIGAGRALVKLFRK